MANRGIWATVLNRAQVIAQLRAVRKATLGAYEGTAMRAGKDIMLISKSEFVPIETGALMGSGRVEKEGLPGGKFQVLMKYGGPPDYAVAVHEVDKNYRNGRQWKYLETPAKQFNFQVMMTTDMRRRMAGRIGGLTSAARAGRI